MEENIKKDFLVFTAFLLSRGVTVAGRILKDQSVGGVIITSDDVDYIQQIFEDNRWEKVSDNFVKYLKFLIGSERDPAKLRNLSALSEFLTGNKASEFMLSLN
ncbi:MAG: hypothetical protein ACLFQX_07645 [Candidatus Kapaibacterium sp.]